MMRAFVSTAIRASAAMLVLTTAWATTPSGRITANPEVVIVPAGTSSGTTSIPWTTVNCAAAQVTVTAACGTEQLFGDAVSFKDAAAPWIGLTAFTFRLYGAEDPQASLCPRNQKGLPPGKSQENSATTAIFEFPPHLIAAIRP